MKKAIVIKPFSEDEQYARTVDNLEHIISMADHAKNYSTMMKFLFEEIPDSEFRSYGWFCNGIKQYAESIINISNQLLRKTKKEHKSKDKTQNKNKSKEKQNKK